MAKNNRGPLLDHLDELEAKCLKGDPTLKEIFEVFGPDGHFVLILFMILPFLQPIPMLGLSTPFGLLIAFVACLAYLRKPPWIPNAWAQKKVAAKTVSRIAEGSERIFEKLAFLIHPRWNFLFKGIFRPINTGLLIANAILLALPIPVPFSNAIPAWMILFQTLGSLEEDGLFIILSYLQTVLCLVYFFLLAKGLGAGFEMIAF